MTIDTQTVFEHERIAALAAEAFALAQHAKSGAKVMNDETARIVDGGKNSGPNTSRAWGCGLDGALSAHQAQQLVDRIEAFYAQRKRRAGVMLAPSAALTFQRELAKRDYVFDGLNIVASHDLASHNVQGRNANIQVRETTDVDEFAAVAQLAFGPAPAGTSHHTIGQTFLKIPYRCFTAFVDGRAVGIGGYVTVEGTALMMAAGTLPAARGQGVQRALIAYRLGACRAQGLERALVHVAPESTSMRNLVREGFVPRYSQTRLLAPSLSK